MASNSVDSDVVTKILKDFLILENVSLPLENLHYMCRTGDMNYPVPYPCNENNEDKIIVN